MARVYTAGPLGPGGSEKNGDWRTASREYFESRGIDVVEPLEAANYSIYGAGMDTTVAKVLTERDKRFSMESEYLLVNFDGASARSMGTCVEMGWADAAGTTIVTVLPEVNPHRHPIIESVSDYIVRELHEAWAIIASLATDKLEA